MNVKPFPLKRSWLNRCIKDAHGSPIPNVHNAIEALRGDPTVRDCFAFDEMLRVPMMMRAIGTLACTVRAAAGDRQRRC
jgi:hypothetical protein